MEDTNVTGWRKSTFSGGNGGSCVEVGITGWRKSTYSGGNGGQCVEVGDTARSAVAVRDTADRNGVTLTIQAGAWRAFIAACR